MALASSWKEHIWITNEVVNVATDREEVLQGLEQYLIDKKVTLWQSWDLHQPSRRRQAAEFILDLVTDVNAKGLVP
jgi:hypothetical protein